MSLTLIEDGFSLLLSAADWDEAQKAIAEGAAYKLESDNLAFRIEVPTPG